MTKQGAGARRSNPPKGGPDNRRRARSATAGAAAARQRRIRLGALGLGVAVVVAVAVFASSGGGGGSGVTRPEAFDLPALSGGGCIRLADFRGKPTVVNFFASWCTACDSELPGFSRLSTNLKGRVNFVGVDSLETGDRLYMPRRHHITWWPLAKDVGGAQGSGLHDALGGGSGMPLTAFYDAAGHLLDTERAALPEDTLRGKLHQLYGLDV
ncbi:MAG TPA: TlpA disulfide reductase family protein [Acidimicrobiales bacterium]|nr:TlpA disulfide reductase family protein [Acidimicrobiales bacterium]